MGGDLYLWKVTLPLKASCLFGNINFRQHDHGEALCGHWGQEQQQGDVFFPGSIGRSSCSGVVVHNCMYNCIFAMHNHNRHQPFEILTRPSSSVTPVTQDHFYSTNETRYNAPPRKLGDTIPSQVPHPTCFWTSMAVGEPDQ